MYSAWQKTHTTKEAKMWQNWYIVGGCAVLVVLYTYLFITHKESGK